MELSIDVLPMGAQQAIAEIQAYESDRCDVCGEAHHIEAPETLHSGQTANLVFDDGHIRVWHDRTGEEPDGPFAVEVLTPTGWVSADIID